MLLALLVSFLAALLARVLVPRFRHSGWLVPLLPAGLFVYFLLRGLGLEGAEALVERVNWVPTLGISLTLRLDGFSLLFALVITGIGTLVTIYAGAYFSHAPAQQRASFLSLILLFMSAMLGTVLADDLVVLFVFWEATSLLSFALIGFHSARLEARKAALQSLIVTAGGGLALFAGILLIGVELGSFSLSHAAARSAELIESPLVIPIMVLVLVGAFTKSAQVPFHFWLPAAMEAPTPASAYLHSATMVKLGVYLLARFDQVFAGLPEFGTTLVIVGSATMLVAAIGALASHGYKAVLAHSTVGSLGLLVMLVGLDGEIAVTATIVFILAHALYKATLFFCAGTVIHATHEGSLHRLRGLRRALPRTAFAASLAAVSMAGLPPTLGFIAKEALFEGQIDAAAGAVVMGVALVASAVFVAIAGAVALGPFFFGTHEPTAIHDGETLGLTVGPLFLGALGLLLGLAPGVTASKLVGLATAALLGHSVDVSLSLWHGFTPMLALSAVAIALGIGIFLARNAFQARLARSRTFTHLIGDSWFQRAFNGVLHMASLSTRLLQNGDQHRYSATVVVTVLAITGAGLVASGVPLRLDLDRGAFDASSTVVLAIMAIGALAATRARSLLAAMISVGVVGFGSAVIFLMNGAPDLALTQFSVEVLVVVLFTALLLRIPVRVTPTRAPGEERWDLLLAIGTGLVIFIALSAMVTAPLDLRLTEYFAATSYAEAHGRNVVNVIIVDYRALDTLGEISVVAFAAIATWGLLRRRGMSGGGN